MFFLEKSDRLKVFYCFSLFILSLSSHLSAQFLVSGQVFDQVTGEPLPFVNLVFNGDQRNGTTADIHGRFSYQAKSPVASAIISFVGYDTRVESFSADQKLTDLKFYLVPSDIALGEVVVRAGENPANRIIREVIRNKEINNPEKLSSFRYKSYNKVVYDFKSGDSLATTQDLMELDSVFRGGHFMIMESVTERKFVKPNHTDETVLATRVSGFQSASFAPLATDIQPFSFYDDYISVIDIAYLNPISNGSLSKYEFHLRDTLFHEDDTTFILSFKPLPGTNFEALTGLLYINTNQYAIQHVIAEPYEKGFFDVSIQQQYRLINGSHWFPEQLKFELFLQDNASNAFGISARGVSMIEEVELDPDLEKRDFSIEEVHLHPMANARDSVFWNESRLIPLDAKEALTYEVMDSLGNALKFDNILKIAERAGQGKIPLGIIDFDISKILIYNKYEGIRLGLGVYTNDKLIKNISIGGYAGYGFKDHTWKFGGEAMWYLNATRDSEIRFGYHNTLQETGKSWLGFYRPRSFDFRTFLASQMDHVEKMTGSISFRTFRYAKVHLAFNRMKTDPRYAYTFQENEQAPVRGYTNTDMTLILRYAYKERLIHSMGQRISMGTKFPVLTLAYTRGFDGVLDGMFEFHKLEARMEHSVRFRNFGKSSLRLDAGIVDQAIPYGILFTGEGSYVRQFSVLIKNSFMTATPYEFLSDRYVHMHYAHEFGSLLFHIGKWRPSVSIYQNIGWGSLQHPEYHQGIAFKTKEKGLYESGLQLDNLIKTKYLNVSYLGMGAGAFVRYGPYAAGKFNKDVVFTLSMTFTTK